MTALFAFVWLVIVGTNAAQAYVEAPILEGLVILAGAAYFGFALRAELFDLLTSVDYLLALTLFAAPILLMLGSEREFARGEYTAQMGYLLVFVVASMLAMRPDLARTIVVASFAIVSIGVALNLYELLVEPNMWSVAPGRSAGFYFNPNISSQALLGFGLYVLASRFTKLTAADLALIGMVIVGVFTTFSRAGILAGALLLATVTLMRIRSEHVPRLVIGGGVIALASAAFISYAVNNLALSEDAIVRVLSLVDSFGIEDYESNRGDTAAASLNLFNRNPVFGTGVRTIYEMVEGPHNMFVAMLVDYGIVGLSLFILVIIRLVIIALGAERDASRGMLFFVAWLIIFGLASHTLLGDTSTLLLFGFALARASRTQTAESYVHGYR